MPKMLSGRRVLVVEDEFFLADEMADALRGAGAVVVGPVASDVAALDLIKAGGIDIAILDINLQGTMSFALADDLTARNIPFVFATGYDAASIPEEYRAVPRWEKPFDAGALAQSLL